MYIYFDVPLMFLVIIIKTKKICTSVSAGCIDPKYCNHANTRAEEGHTNPYLPNKH